MRAVYNKPARNRAKAPNPLRQDPARISSLARRFSADLERRYVEIKRRVRKLLVEDDAFILRTARVLVDHALAGNVRFTFSTDAERVKAFQEWLRSQEESLGLSDELLWERYIREGYLKGAGRAFDETRKSRIYGDTWDQPMDFYQGTREQFLRSAFGRPERTAKVKLLAGRVFSDLQGINEAMETGMTRVLVDGLVQGKNPFSIAKDLESQVDGIARTRARLLARTEILRAHSEGQLDGYEELGVDQLGVLAEWITATDPCPACGKLSGVVLRIEEARGLIPRHPNCRCTWVPANVGESTTGQIRTKGDVEQAFRDSVATEKRKKESLEDRLERTTWPGPDKAIAAIRPEPLISNWGETINRSGPSRSYFADCFRDTKGRCLPRGSLAEGYATSAEIEESVKLAKQKIKNAPVPTKEQVRKARKELALAARHKGRPGGESRGGSAASRRKQRQNLFKEWGGDEKGYVVCPWTGLKMHWTDDPKINPHGYPKFERGKIFTKWQGGGYQLPNLIPESRQANAARNNAPVRQENLK